MEREALKLALEFVESVHSGEWGSATNRDELVAAIKAALAQPAQEPVAKPYAYEYGRCNADGTYSVVIEKGDLVQTMTSVYNYVRPRNAHKDRPIKELFDAPALDEAAARIGEIKGFGQATQHSFAVFIQGLKR